MESQENLEKASWNMGRVFQKWPGIQLSKVWEQESWGSGEWQQVVPWQAVSFVWRRDQEASQGIAPTGSSHFTYEGKDAIVSQRRHQRQWVPNVIFLFIY